MSAVVRVSDVMVRNVISVDTSASIFEAVSKMLNSDVGSIIVVKGKYLAGILTKGDVLRKAILRQLDPNTPYSVDKIMSHNLVTIGKDATLEDASILMIQNKVSKLPVLENGNLVGIITSTDIIRTEPMMVGHLHELLKAKIVPHELA